MKLDELEIGGEAVITSVGGDTALRCRLLDMGLIPNTKIKLIKRAPMGDPAEYLLRGYALTLRNEEARLIDVRINEKDGEPS